MSDPIREVYDLVQHLGWETALEDPDMLGTEGWAVLLRKMWAAIKAHAEAPEHLPLHYKCGEACCLERVCHHGCTYPDAVECDLRERVLEEVEAEQAPPVLRWIPVKEWLPEYDGPCLLDLGTRHLVAWYSTDKLAWVDNDGSTWRVADSTTTRWAKIMWPDEPAKTKEHTIVQEEQPEQQVCVWTVIKSRFGGLMFNPGCEKHGPASLESDWTCCPYCGCKIEVRGAKV